MSNYRDSVLEFGRELINARLYKKISIEQIAEITKIERRYLEAMEEGEWDLLPKPYMEAFLKAYAETVGMNVPKVMKKYQEMVRREPVEPGEAEEGEEVEEKEGYVEEEPLLRAPISRRVWAFVGAALTLVVVIVVVMVLRSCKEEPDRVMPGGDTAAPAEEIRQQSELPESRPEISAESQDLKPDSLGESARLTEVQPRITTKILLRARAVENCWLQATLDQSRIRDVLLAPGDTIALQAVREIHLVVGNAGGLELILGDQFLGVLGPIDKPVTLVIGPEGIESQRLGAWHLNYEGEIRPDLGNGVLRDSTF